MNETIKPKRYIEFDGLRGWLALWVATAHIFCWCGYGRLDFTGKKGAIWTEFTAADSAVETFIILSGFAIHTLMMREPKSYPRYLTGRFFRIYPVYALSLAMGMLLIPVVARMVTGLPWHENYYIKWMGLMSDQQSAHPSAHGIWHVTLLHGLLPKSVLEYASTTLLKPAWSISLEWQYYLSAPLIAWLLCRRSGVAALIIAALIGKLGRGYWENPDNAFLLRWLPMFMVGIISAEFAARCERDPSLTAKHGLSIIGIGLGLALFFFEVQLSFMIWTLAYSLAIGAWDQVWPRLGRVLGGALRLAPARWLGDVSYPLYLLHWPFIIGSIAALQIWDPGMSQRTTLLLLLGVGMPVLLLSSWAVHSWIEKPLMRLGKRLSGRALPPDPKADA